jgi:hypothetical protein
MIEQKGHCKMLLLFFGKLPRHIVTDFEKWRGSLVVLLLIIE